jgi:hypothetical protein
MTEDTVQPASGPDDLLEQAQARLQELEEADNGDELGDRIELAPGEHFRGRWRGEAVMRTKDGDSFPVFALWDADGKPRFHYKNAALVPEVDESRPEIGDEIVVVRGEDREFEAQGEQRRMHRYAVRTRASSESLPGQAAAPAQGELGEDEEIPF